MLHLRDQSWQLRAFCRGPESDLFFAPLQQERREEKELRETRAKELCRRCPVRAQCLDYALDIREPFGIWGGLNEIERRSLLTRRAG